MRKIGRAVRAEETTALSEAKPEEEDQGSRGKEESAEAPRSGETIQRLAGGKKESGRERQNGRRRDREGPGRPSRDSSGLSSTQEERLEVPGALPVPHGEDSFLLRGRGEAVVLLLRVRRRRGRIS